MPPEQVKEYEAGINVTETVDVLSEPPKEYKAKIEIAEVVDVISEPPREFEAKIEITEIVDVISEPPKEYEAKIPIEEVVDVIAAKPRVFDVQTPVVEQVPVEIALRPYEARIIVVEDVSVVVPPVIDPHIEALRQTIAKMVYRISGDIVQANDYTLVVLSLWRQRDINDSLLGA